MTWLSGTNSNVLNIGASTAQTLTRTVSVFSSVDISEVGFEFGNSGETAIFGRYKNLRTIKSLTILTTAAKFFILITR